MEAANIQRDEKGAERCRKIKKGVIQSGTGFVRTDVYCNKPVLFSIAQGRKICPDCEKEPPVGNPQPRVTNAAGISLTKKELEECGVTDGEDPSLKAPTPKPVVATIAVEAKVAEVNKDGVNVYISLTDLEGNADVAALVLRKVVEAMGTLPVTNFKESKRLIKLEEKLEGLLGA